MGDNLSRNQYILELSSNNAGSFLAKWEIPRTEWKSSDKIRIYEDASKSINDFLEETAVINNWGSHTFATSVDPGVELRYIQGGTTELYRTSPFPKVVMGMTNDTYYPTATTDIKSMQITYKNGFMIVKAIVNNPQNNDFIGLYDSLLATHDRYLYKIDKDSFDSEVTTNVQLSGRIFARYITTDSSLNLKMVRRTFQMAENLSIHEKCDKDLSPDEKYTLLRQYPKIELDLVKKTDNPTYEYNCIGWSLGFDDRWINPLGSIPSMIEFYEIYGCKETTTLDEQKIDLWATVDLKPTHGSKFLKEENFEAVWESKLGASERITHNRCGVENGTYGVIVKSFTVPQLSNQYHREKREWSCFELNIIDKEIKKISLELVHEFEVRFIKWKNTWFQGETKYSSNTNDLKKVTEYQQLCELGEEVIPLLIRKLCDEENFPALVLYDELQGDNHLKLNNEEQFDIWIMGEQERTVQSVVQWINNKRT
ncbi:DUF7689 domain-containing protein [Candidatus Stoquefichus massiliensis]|uniref:DUF7689 domain-containing protein n=1 Tax=Candidatus Stoquefichus massiliensis TaxID=1470350 RepID=UPI0004B9D041|nr:hypothetical protein [Candidatus Stoquefichus massiliensis]